MQPGWLPQLTTETSRPFRTYIHHFGGGNLYGRTFAASRGSRERGGTTVLPPTGSTSNLDQAQPFLVMCSHSAADKEECRVNDG